MLKSSQEGEKSVNPICGFTEMGWWIDKEKKLFTRNKIMKINEVQKNIQARNNKGVFKTIYNYSSMDRKDSFLVGDFYLDFDCKDDFEKVREDVKQALAYLEVVFKIKPESTNIYFSGNKGVHITVPYKYLGVVPSKNLNQIYGFIAKNICKYSKNKTIDLQIYDNRRLFRIPNSIHEVSGYYKIQLSHDEIRNSSIEKIHNLATSPRKLNIEPHFNVDFSYSRIKDIELNFKKEEELKSKLNMKFKATMKITPPCIKYILECGAVDGTRNNIIAILASFYRNKGVDFQNTLKYINKWNTEKNVPPTLENEIFKTTRSIFRGNANFGCNAIKNYYQCVESKCPLKNRRASNDRYRNIQRQ